MLTGFNAFQIVTLFALMAPLIAWLWRGPFYGSAPLLVLSSVVYIVMYVGGIILVADKIDKK